MPKLPRVSGAQALKALEKLGFEKVRQRGSHVVARRGVKGCVIPMHPELKAGTLDTNRIQAARALRLQHFL